MHGKCFIRNRRESWVWKSAIKDKSLKYCNWWTKMPTDLHICVCRNLVEPFDNSYGVLIRIIQLYIKWYPKIMTMIWYKSNLIHTEKQKRTTNVIFIVFIYIVLLIWSRGGFLCLVLQSRFALFFDALYSHFISKCLSYKSQRLNTERWMCATHWKHP